MKKARKYVKHLKKRASIRSKTFPGIAKAMATQWSEYLTKLNIRATEELVSIPPNPKGIGYP